VVKFRESKKGRGGSQPVAAGVVAPDWEDNDLTALVGTVVTYLGEESELAADVYSIGWQSVEVGARLPAGRIVSFPGRVRNTSPTVWRAQGASAVSLAYHWLAEDGTKLVWEGLRTSLPRDVEPGKSAQVMFEVETPRQPGRYRLVFDAVRERISWFSDRRPEAALSRDVEIVPPGDATAESTAATAH